MTAESPVKLRLTVWRDFVPNKALVLRRDSGNEQQLVTDSDFQQEVYSWQTREDPFAGVSDQEDRLHLGKLLFDRFEASQPPSQRRVDVLSDFLNEAARVIEANRAEWAVSQDAPLDDEEVPYRLNPLLTLSLHLKWVANTFAGQPGVSVSIR